MRDAQLVMQISPTVPLPNTSYSRAALKTPANIAKLQCLSEIAGDRKRFRLCK